jgi:hypothetical protein
MSLSSSNFAWSLDKRPELNNPIFKTPLPCVWGSSCYYHGCCRFVHPGEEGTGRKLFPGRISFDPITKMMFWEPPVVRLIGNPSFYERRRKGMSWPQWIAYKQMASASKPSYICASCSSEEATMPHPQNASLVTKNMYCGECFWEVSDDIKNSGRAARRAAWEKEMLELKENYREKFFHIAYQTLQEQKETLIECGMLHRNVTAGKIVSVILKNNNSDVLERLLKNENYQELAYEMYSAYEKVFEEEKGNDTLYKYVY